MSSTLRTDARTSFCMASSPTLLALSEFLPANGAFPGRVGESAVRRVSSRSTGFCQPIVNRAIRHPLGAGVEGGRSQRMLLIGITCTHTRRLPRPPAAAWLSPDAPQTPRRSVRERPGGSRDAPNADARRPDGSRRGCFRWPRASTGSSSRARRLRPWCGAPEPPVWPVSGIRGARTFGAQSRANRVAGARGFDTLVAADVASRGSPIERGPSRMPPGRPPRSQRRQGSHGL
jgi:hypothetical protein